MVKLRLKRMGEKFNAFYRIVAADSRAPRDGRFIEELGYYNPHTKEIKINAEIRAKWEKVGAIPTDTVKTLFKKYDALNKPGKVAILKVKMKKKLTKKAIAKEQAKKEEASKEAAAKTEVPKEEVVKEVSKAETSEDK